MELIPLNNIANSNNNNKTTTNTPVSTTQRRLHLSKQTALDTPIHKLGSHTNEMFYCSHMQRGRLL